MAARPPSRRQSGRPSRSATPRARCRQVKGDAVPDPDLRDYENVPLGEDIDEYFAREVLPHVADAWIDETQDEDRLRDPVHPPLLRLQAARARSPKSTPNFAAWRPRSRRYLAEVTS